MFTLCSVEEKIVKNRALHGIVITFKCHQVQLKCWCRHICYKGLINSRFLISKNLQLEETISTKKEGIRFMNKNLEYGLNIKDYYNYFSSSKKILHTEWSCDVFTMMDGEIKSTINFIHIRCFHIHKNVLYR